MLGVPHFVSVIKSMSRAELTPLIEICFFASVDGAAGDSPLRGARLQALVRLIKLNQMEVRHRARHFNDQGAASMKCWRRLAGKWLTRS
jgi:hypothetical protein